MEKPMRRKDRQMDELKAKDLLTNGEYGVLGTLGENATPYGTPISYVYKNDCIYFHCANSGHKLENIKNNSNVCFTVIGKTKPVYKSSFTTLYESVIAFGSACIISDEKEANEALIALCEKYLPDYIEYAQFEIEKYALRTCIVKITINSITGKENT